MSIKDKHRDLDLDKILTDVDPLNDKAFKIALENYDEVFNDLVKYVVSSNCSCYAFAKNL